MNKQELIRYIEAVIDEKYSGSQVAFARVHDISQAYVSDVLKGRRDPGQKMLDAVGMQKVIEYRSKLE